MFGAEEWYDSTFKTKTFPSIMATEACTLKFAKTILFRTLYKICKQRLEVTNVLEREIIFGIKCNVLFNIVNIICRILKRC